MIGFEWLIPAVSIGLSVISCISTVILWVWQIRKLSNTGPAIWIDPEIK